VQLKSSGDMIGLRVPVRCTKYWGVKSCPAKKNACRVSGGPL